MNQRWLQIDKLFAQALSVNGPERESFVLESCRNDKGLEEEVREYLNLAMRIDGFLEKAPPIPSGINAEHLRQALIDSFL